MLKETNVTRVDCPACGNRLLNKGEGAHGPVEPKCFRCKRVWEVDLGTGESKLISGKGLPRR